MRTFVYVDAFNLYYGCLRKTPYRWLDLRKLCTLLFPKNDLVKIKYFTALASARPDNPELPLRQQTYIRALRTLPELSIHFGHYLTHEVMMRQVVPRRARPKYVKVLKTEEKGSDVNLATHLVSDAYEEAFDTAVVITNDSDLLEPIRLVTGRLRKRVGVVNPHEHPSMVLVQSATFVKQIRKGVLVASQFADQLVDGKGMFERPLRWK